MTEFLDVGAPADSRHPGIGIKVLKPMDLGLGDGIEVLAKRACCDALRSFGSAASAVHLAYI
jgi:hypothetical protein